MGKKGALLVSIIVGVVYPVLTAALILIVLMQSPTFKLSQLFGGQSAPVITADNPAGLSEFQLKNGVGPITEEIRVGPVDEALAMQGKELFKIKCSGCHKLDQRYVGPALRGVTSFRTPTYIMNMILNPQEMVQKHPVAKGLLIQHLTVMSPQGMDREKARAVLEFLRWDFEESTK